MLNRRAGGFTLIEVLVALTIIAISLGALISTSGSQASSVAYLKQKTIAHWIAMNELTRLQVENEWPDKGESEGSLKMAGVEWFWAMTVLETEDEDSRQIEYRVYLDEDRENSLSRLLGYLSRPDDTVITTQ